MKTLTTPQAATAIAAAGHISEKLALALVFAAGSLKVGEIAAIATTMHDIPREALYERLDSDTQMWCNNKGLPCVEPLALTYADGDTPEVVTVTLSARVQRCKN